MKALIIAAILAVSPAGIRTEIGTVCNRETIETQGHLWNYDTEFEQGSVVLITFNENGTEEIEDDIILEVEMVRQLQTTYIFMKGDNNGKGSYAAEQGN